MEDQDSQTVTNLGSNCISRVDLLIVCYSETFFMKILWLIVHFLGQATQFSVTQNVPKYHFIKRTIEIYHHGEHVFMGKCTENPM